MYKWKTANHDHMVNNELNFFSTSTYIFLYALMKAILSQCNTCNTCTCMSDPDFLEKDLAEFLEPV